jgi:imidazolonepropionase-like amidohydrolase
MATGCGDNSGSDTPKGHEKDVVFVSGALLIPGDGTPPVEEATMIIEDGMITKLGKKREFFAPKGAYQVDLEGKSMTPLLVNLHAYPGLSNQKEFGAKNYNRESLSADLNRYGYYGVGAVLAAGDSDGLAYHLRDELRGGKATGAQLYTSGRGIAAKGGSGVLGSIPLLVTGDADARKAVSELADRNSDAIVVWADGMKAEASDAIIDEAHKRKLKVFASAPGLAEAKNLVKANVDGLISSIRDREVDDELVSMMKEKKIPLAPSLTALESRFVYAEKTSWLGEHTMREVYPGNLSAYLSDPVIMNKFRRNPQIGTFRQEFATASKNLKTLADAGVPIAMGSGSGLIDTFPGYFEHRELELMVKAGIAAMDAIKAATSVSAAVLGVNDHGVLAAGKKGSFIVYSSNPLEAITNSKDIESVYINGHLLDRLEMVRQIKVEKVTVSEADRKTDEQVRQREAEEAADAGLKKYGKFPLGPAQSVTVGLNVFTPKRSKSVVSGGPPYKVTVTNPRGSAAELRDFYSKVLAETKWTAAGDCWEKANPVQAGKKWRLCTEASEGQILLNISVQ